MALFSERYGYTKPSDVLIRETITEEIVNGICSCYDYLNVEKKEKEPQAILHAAFLRFMGWMYKGSF